MTLDFGDDFLGMAPIAQATKEKIDKLDNINILKWYPRIQSTEWKGNLQNEKIFANIPDKGLIFRICKEGLQLKHPKNPI